MSMIVAIFGLLLATTLSAQSQQSSSKQKPSDPSTQTKQGMMGGKMMGRCQAMMEERQKMQAEMKAMDTELDKLVTEMNNAPENKKADAVAAVVTKMVEQRRTIEEKTQSMQMRMMQHMMGHNQMEKGSMSQCPMMKEMRGENGPQGKPKKSGADHPRHHQ
jgi:hypothetical protein